MATYSTSNEHYRKTKFSFIPDKNDFLRSKKENDRGKEKQSNYPPFFY